MNDPRHNQQYASQLERAKRVRKSHTHTLLSLLAIFGLPILIAIVLNTQAGSAWVKSIMKPSQHGLLVTPTQWIQEMVKQSDLKGKWAITVITTDLCEQRCLDLLGMLQGIRTSMGGNQTRVQVWLMGSRETALDEENKNFQQFVFNRNVIDQFISNITTEDATKKQDIMERNKIAGRGTSMGIYLIDPDGRIVMMYPQDTDLKGIRKDLQRLLKASG